MKTWAAGEQLLASDLNANFEEVGGLIPFVIPDPAYASNREMANMNVAGNTTGFTAGFQLSNRITINKISFSVGTINTSGTFKFGIYSANGQTRYCNETSATISAGGLYTHTLAAALTLPVGVYYFVVVPIGTADLVMNTWQELNTAGNQLSGVSGEPVQRGTQTVTAGTLPVTFNPITGVTNSSTGKLPVVRFDN